MKTREESTEYLQRYIETENLRHHCRMVAAAMEAYAGSLNKSGEEVDRWWTAAHQ